MTTTLHPIDGPETEVRDEVVQAPAGPSGSAAHPRGRVAHLLRGRADDPAWVRPSLLSLLGATALLYVWGLGASGWANSFYSAAVQAGTKSWKAAFFGSFDASSAITVDKPPASLWVMELSARVFGVNSWSILVPQALEGVAAVGVLYLAVRRWFGPAAGLIAGAVLATTPVAVLMFRFNNPDALLVLLLVVAAYALTRALEDGRSRWLVVAAACIGTGFITKMMQAFVVVPGFALVYLIAAPNPLRRRLFRLVQAGVALAVATLWWPVVVSLVPAADRPYIGGSQNNSIWNLIFGYNGFGRITGNETGSVGGRASAGTNSGMWGPTGWNRLFNSEFGGQASWLIPAALVLLAGGLWATRRAPRTDQLRAALLIWGSWLVVTGLTFSYAAGIIHPYYTVALGPAIGACVGIGGVALWRLREQWWARSVLAASVLAAAGWSYALLDRTPSWHPWLRVMVLLVGFATAGALLVTTSLVRRIAVVVVTGGLVTALAGPTAYALDTAATIHSGALPTAGPATQGGFGPGAGRGPGGRRGFGAPPAFARNGSTNGNAFPGFGAQGQNGFPGFGAQGQNGFPGGAGPTTNGGAAGGGRTGGGGAGGLLNGSTPGTELTAMLKAGASGYRWVAAVVGANSASGYQLASGDPVMAIGGFNGTDPSPTLAHFQAYVAAGKVHYFIAGGGGFGPGGGTGGSSSSSAIASWVEQTFTAQTVNGVTVYDLTSASSGTTASSGAASA